MSWFHFEVAGAARSARHDLVLLTGAALAAGPLLELRGAEFRLTGSLGVWLSKGPSRSAAPDGRGCPATARDGAQYQPMTRLDPRSPERWSVPVHNPLAGPFGGWLACPHGSSFRPQHVRTGAGDHRIYRDSPGQGLVRSVSAGCVSGREEGPQAPCRPRGQGQDRPCRSQPCARRLHGRGLPRPRQRGGPSVGRPSPPFDGPNDAARGGVPSCAAGYGFEALLSSPVLGGFLVHAAEFLVQEGRSLEWRPILEAIGVPQAEQARYPELYDRLEAELDRRGRRVVRREGRRRFLATLLREGGLPLRIGNLPEVLGSVVGAIGWESLTGPEGMASRSFAVSRLKARADGTLRRLLDDASEATDAIEELLADAADARAALSGKGIDPTTLATADEVRKALDRHRIALPGARNDQLLTSLLATFRERSKPAQLEPESALPPSLQLFASEQPGERIELRLRFDVGDRWLRSRVPESVSHVSVSMDPGAREPRLLVWSDESKSFEDEAGNQTLEWRCPANSSAVTIAARYAAEDGTAAVLALGSVEMPDDAAWWFDGNGLELRQEPDVLRIGQRLMVVARDDIEVQAEGGIRALRRSPPSGLARAWVLEAAGEGSARVVRGGDEVLSVECRGRVLPLHVEGGEPSRWSTSPRCFERLPDLVLEDTSLAVDVELGIGPRGDLQVVARGVVGRVRLGSFTQVRGVSGTVRARLQSADGRSWSARWSVIAPHVVQTLEPGLITFASPDLAHVSTVRGVVSRLTEGGFLVRVPPDDDRLSATLGFTSGDTVSVSIPMPRSFVRLWRDFDLREDAPLDGSSIITEREVFANACIEVRSEPDRGVSLDDEAGPRIASARTDRFGRAFLTLRDVVRYQLRAAKSSVMVAVQVDGSPVTSRLQVRLPRMERPTPAETSSQLTLRITLDGSDLPAKPMFACFDILRPFDASGPHGVRPQLDRSTTVRGERGRRETPRATQWLGRILGGWRPRPATRNVRRLPRMDPAWHDRAAVCATRVAWIGERSLVKGREQGRGRAGGPLRRPSPVRRLARRPDRVRPRSGQPRAAVVLPPRGDRQPRALDLAGSDRTAAITRGVRLARPVAERDAGLHLAPVRPSTSPPTWAFPRWTIGSRHHCARGHGQGGVSNAARRGAVSVRGDARRPPRGWPLTPLPGSRVLRPRTSAGHAPGLVAFGATDGGSLDGGYGENAARPSRSRAPAARAGRER